MAPKAKALSWTTCKPSKAAQTSNKAPSKLKKVSTFYPCIWKYGKENEVRTRLSNIK